MTALLFEVVLFLGCWVVLVFDVCVVLVRLSGIFAALLRVFGARRALFGGFLLEFRLDLAVLLLVGATACCVVDSSCRNMPCAAGH